MHLTTPLISFNATFFMQLITVAVLFLILRKYFFEKVHNFILEREQSIKDAFDHAEAINRKADEKMETYNKRIANYEQEGRDIIQASKTRGDEKAKHILEEADGKVVEMMSAAEREIQRERAKAISDMKEEVGSLAVLVASKVIEKELTMDGKQEEFINKVIEEESELKWQK